jgi:hypothetical protein
MDLADRKPDKLRGTCRVGCYWNLAPLCWAQIQQRWRKLHPDCELSPCFADFDEIDRALSASAIDAALTFKIGLNNVIPISINELSWHFIKVTNDIIKFFLGWPTISFSCFAYKPQPCQGDTCKTNFFRKQRNAMYSSGMRQQCAYK